MVNRLDFGEMDVIMCLARQPAEAMVAPLLWRGRSKAAYPVKDKAALLIFEIQNCNDEKPKCQDNHQFLITTHKLPPFCKTQSRSFRLPAARLSTLFS